MKALAQHKLIKMLGVTALRQAVGFQKKAAGPGAIIGRRLQNKRARFIWHNAPPRKTASAQH